MLGTLPHSQGVGGTCVQKQGDSAPQLQTHTWVSRHRVSLPGVGSLGNNIFYGNRIVTGCSQLHHENRLNAAAAGPALWWVPRKGSEGTSGF